MMNQRISDLCTKSYLCIRFPALYMYTHANEHETIHEIDIPFYTLYIEEA